MLLALEQLEVRASLDDAFAFQNQNFVGPGDRAEAGSDHKARVPRRQPGGHPLQPVLRCGTCQTSGFIQDEGAWIGHQRARKNTRAAVAHVRGSSRLRVPPHPARPAGSRKRSRPSRPCAAAAAAAALALAAAKTCAGFPVPKSRPARRPSHRRRPRLKLAPQAIDPEARRQAEMAEAPACAAWSFSENAARQAASGIVPLSR